MHIFTANMSEHVTDRANISITMKQEVIKWLKSVYLHLTLAHSKGQGSSTGSTAQRGQLSPAPCCGGSMGQSSVNLTFYSSQTNCYFFFHKPTLSLTFFVFVFSVSRPLLSPTIFHTSLFIPIINIPLHQLLDTLRYTLIIVSCTVYPQGDQCCADAPSLIAL